MIIRERIEQLERETLSPYAALSTNSRGRERPEEPCDVRTVYQRDRDRIIHQCKAFRRLAHKTQVFISPRHDHIRTRLSHTLEVSQIARTIAKALRLNESLTEAIALGHDVGHTPFGHAGEEVLHAVYREYDPDARFHHAEHSVRVVTALEREGQGLNLCRETVDGIGSHSKGRRGIAQVLERERPLTLEALVVSLSDRVAYLNHDLDDCLGAGLIRPDDLPAECVEVLGARYSQRISTMVSDIIEQSEGQSAIRLSPSIIGAVDALKEFMYERVYHSPPMIEERRRVRMVIESLFRLYMTSEDALAAAVGRVPESTPDRARAVCDYVAGMTDRYATDRYVESFLPGGVVL
ncbi:MAG: deoxyguanosinetriphosphate triphosphohydrolase [Armatimonadetes bacterium]|nr:deoxyguanosinetriphosphate triphosphohydrolase [Armatimonadota bacterium]